MEKESRLIQGLMRLNSLSSDDLLSLVEFDLDHNINFFDISDIYSDGECERKLGEVLKKKPELRERMIIQSKCGIVKDRAKDICYYDLSKKHIIESCLASLKRLNTTYLDYFLLHRPDIFLDAKEVKEAVNYLKSNGYIKHFGVSNFPVSIVKYLVNEGVEVEVNQLQLGLGHSNMVSSIFNFNTDFNESYLGDNEIYFYLKENKIKLECRSPYFIGLFSSNLLKEINENLKYNELKEYLDILRNKYNLKSNVAILNSFLLSLNNSLNDDDNIIYVISGSTNKEHIEESLEGLNIKLTKEEWYTLYRKALYKLP